MTTARPADRESYWDRRILQWERARYDGRIPWRLPPVEWAAALRPGPTRLRRTLALHMIAPYLPGRHVVEAGCGTGRLAEAIIRCGAASYVGLDVSREAVAQARRRAVEAAFIHCPATELPENRDLVVSLGLLDWMSDEELRAFFLKHGQADFLHTFSERSANPRKLAQRAFRRVAAALRPRVPRPRFLTLEHLRGLMPPAFSARARALRAPGLRDAVFITSLPL